MKNIIFGAENQVRLQIFTKNGGPLAKRVTLGEGGELIKDSDQCTMLSGTVETLTLDSMAAAADLLVKSKPNQAIGLSTTNYPNPALFGEPLQRVVADRMRAPGEPLQRVVADQMRAPGDIARSLNFLRYEPGTPAFVLFDRDSSDGERLSCERAMAILRDLIRDFDSLAALSTHSSSSFIYDADGVVLAGEGNHHTYIIAANGADIPRFAKALEGHLWLRGYGRPFITKSGAFLARTVFDSAVFSPERLVFEAGADLGPGLIQKRPAPWHREGRMLDTSTLHDLTPAQREEVARLKAKCRDSVVEKVKEVRAAYVKAESAKLVTKGMTDAQALATVGWRTDGLLTDADLLYFDHLKGEARSAGHVRNNQDDYIGLTLADPLEPDYTGKPGSKVKGKAMMVETEDGDLKIKSFAHGETWYLFAGDLIDVFDELEPLEVTPEVQAIYARNAERWALNAAAAAERGKFKDPDAIAAQRREHQIAENRRIGEGAHTVPKAELMSLATAESRLVFVESGSLVVDILTPHYGLTLADTSNAYAASKVKIPQLPRKNARGELVPRADIEKPLISTWLQSTHRKSVFGRTFKAGSNLFLPDPEGHPALNSWRPFDRSLIITDLTAAGVGMFIDHVAFLFPDASDRARFLDWLAHIEQCPGELPHTAWIHIARNVGMGRNWLASVLARVWAGSVAANLELIKMLESGFNGQLSRKILAVVDEIREGGRDAQWKHSESIKSSVNQETRLINPKFGRQSIEYNSCRLLLFSNHISAIPLDDKDRRFEVVAIDAQPQSPAYYARLYAGLKDPRFIAAVAAFLGQRDISGFNPGVHAVKTEAKQAVSRAGQSPFAEWCQLLVTHWPADVITSKDLYRALFGDGLTGSLNAAHRHTLEDHRVEAFGKTVKVEGVATRVSILRNAHQWKDAAGHQLHDAITSAESVRARRSPQTYLMDRATGEPLEGEHDTSNLF